MSGRASSFLWAIQKAGAFRITHDGRQAALLRGDKAAAFLADMDDMDPEARQEEMARLTGNYRRGNERLAKSHPRNR